MDEEEAAELGATATYEDFFGPRSGGTQGPAMVAAGGRRRQPQDLDGMEEEEEEEEDDEEEGFEGECLRAVGWDGVHFCCVCCLQLHPAHALQGAQLLSNPRAPAPSAPTRCPRRPAG